MTGAMLVFEAPVSRPSPLGHLARSTAVAAQFRSVLGSSMSLCMEGVYLRMPVSLCQAQDVKPRRPLPRTAGHERSR
jgi:hypothetical protein